MSSAGVVVIKQVEVFALGQHRETQGQASCFRSYKVMCGPRRCFAPGAPYKVITKVF